jgi:hypothetical protein
MRPNNPSKRLRGRSRNKSGNPLARSYESNGPDVKIRGSALQVADKYAQLARDAQSAGDRVMAENYLQHAEHYYRIVAAAYEQNNQRPPHIRQEERRFEGDPRGDQPSINGYDGLDEDDDGLRRAIRAGGDFRGYGDGDADDDGEEAPPAPHRNGNHQAQPYQPRHDNGHANGGTMNGHVAEPQPVGEFEAGDVPGEDDEEGGDAKPKRRSRSSRSRSRRRATADAPDGAPLAVPVADPSEPTT